MTRNVQNSPLTLLDSQIAWQCPWYAIRQDRLLRPDGQEYTYNVVQKNDAVWVLPITPKGEVVIIRHYRPTLKEWCWELTAGGVEEGQTPLEAAQKELAEEVGGTAEHWRFLMKISTSNGLTNEYAHIFLAENVTLGDTHHEPMEFISVHTLPFDEAVVMARRGEINDAVSALALLLTAGM